MNKLWSILTTEYYAALKRNAPSSHEQLVADLSSGGGVSNVGGRVGGQGYTGISTIFFSIWS